MLSLTFLLRRVQVWRSFEKNFFNSVFKPYKLHARNEILQSYSGISEFSGLCVCVSCKVWIHKSVSLCVWCIHAAAGWKRLHFIFSCVYSRCRVSSELNWGWLHVTSTTIRTERNMGWCQFLKRQFLSGSFYNGIEKLEVMYNSEFDSVLFNQSFVSKVDWSEVVNTSIFIDRRNFREPRIRRSFMKILRK